MEELNCEMEYYINGEKYLITVTKVVEDKEESTTNTLEVSEDTPPMESEEPVEFSTENIPDGMDISTWLDIIDRYGIILTK